MEPNHLHSKELDYELKIRKIKNTGNVDSKRKLLRGALSQENANHSLVGLFANPYNFDQDVTEITETLTDLQVLVDGFTGVKTDSVFKRINSRLSHLSGRFQRLVGDDEMMKNRS